MGEQGRILAIDWGTKNVGLAASDPLGITAQPLPTLRRTNRRADFARISELVEALNVIRILVGHPLHLKGHAGKRAKEAELFADRLRDHTKLPVELYDERLTSAEAERLMLDAGLSRAKRREKADQIAAQLILQSYLDRPKDVVESA